MNVYEDKMVCFGGFGDGDRLNTVHTLNTGAFKFGSHFRCGAAAFRMICVKETGG